MFRNHLEKVLRPERTAREARYYTDSYVICSALISAEAEESVSGESVNHNSGVHKATLQMTQTGDAHHGQTDPIGSAVQGYVLQQTMAQMQSLAQTVQNLATIPVQPGLQPKAAKPKPEFIAVCNSCWWSADFGHSVRVFMPVVGSTRSDECVFGIGRKRRMRLRDRLEAANASSGSARSG